MDTPDTSTIVIAALVVLCCLLRVAAAGLRAQERAAWRRPISHSEVEQAARRARR